MAIIGALVQLLFFIAIVVVIVRAVSGRKGERGPDEAPLTVKRLLLFGSLYVSLHVAAWGLAGLLALLSDEGRADRAAVPLAMTIVGVPIVLLLGRWVWRSISDPAERGAGFSIYLNLTLATAISVVTFSAVRVGSWIVGDAGFEDFALGALVVWTLIWLGHWWVWNTHRDDSSNLHVYFGAVVGLGTMAGYGGALLAWLFTEVLDAGTSVNLVGEEDAGTRFIGFIVGAAVFAWHWLQTGMREPRDTLWHLYVVLIGVLGGLITAVIGAGITLFGVLQWWFGEPDSTSAVRHFEDVNIPALSALLVGAAVWFYHKQVLGPSQGVRTEIHRVYDYVVAAVGLITGLVGVAILIVAVQEAAFPPDDSMASEANIVIAALTSLAVGAPLWTQAWMRIGRFSKASREAEASSPTRRSYLFGFVGISAVVTAVSLIVLLVMVFDEVLGDGAGRLRDEIQVPIALVITAGGTGAFHFMVLRREREVAVVAERPKQVLLVTASDTLAREVRDLTGAVVSVLRRLDGIEEEENPEAVADAIRASTADHLLIVPRQAGQVEVIPYRR